MVFLGDTLIEREQFHGWMEVMLASQHPNREVTFRNLGWSGDTPAGVSRLGLSHFQATKSPAHDGRTHLSRQLKEAKPTIVFIGYGMASSFEGTEGLEDFIADYERLLANLRELTPAIRLVLLGPIPHETLGPPWPDATEHNRTLRAYDAAIRRLAATNAARFISFFDGFEKAAVTPFPRLTSNGIHSNGGGYHRLATMMEAELYERPGAWRTSSEVEPLREAIVRKNELFFDYSRPANMAYLFGFRKHEQGRNADEIDRFHTLIADEERRIAALRHLRPNEKAPPRSAELREKSAQSVQVLPTLITAEGLEATLWAESPLLTKPIHMNFDPQGRLWVATSEIYPQIEPGQQKIDKVIVLEDVAGRGRADKTSVFADGLHIPTGILPGDGGVYVAQSTELLHYKDTDGDGKADVRQIVLSGFGTEDTHHNLHTLLWGPDGRMYLNQSNNIRTHVETPHGVFRHEAGGVLRFDPRDQRINLVYRGWINPWGHQFDAFGQSFVTDGAGNRGINWGVPGATYVTVAPARRILQSVSPGSYPKFSGLEIIRSRHFQEDWQGDMITCDFRAHRIARFKISEEGAGFVTQRMPDLVRSTSSSFRPVDVKLGPDGALYIADWSNPIIQHGEVDFRDPRRDKAHGRIWRIAAKGRAPLTRVNYTELSTPALLEMLLSPDAYTQASARRVLLERGRDAVVPELKAWTSRITEARSLLAGMNMYQGFNEPVEAWADKLYQSDDPNVRAAAVRALGNEIPFDQLSALVEDAHPRVRLEAVRALGQQTSAPAAVAALRVLHHPMDPFIDYALWLTINELADVWAQAVHRGSLEADLPEEHLSFVLRSIRPSVAGPLLGVLLARNSISAEGEGTWIELIGASGLPSDLRIIFDRLIQGRFSESASLRALQALTDAARVRGQNPAGDLVGLTQLLDHPSGPGRLGALHLAGLWHLEAYSTHLLEIARSAETTNAERSLALQALLKSAGVDATHLLRRLAKETQVAAIRQSAVLTLAQWNADEATQDVIAMLQTLSEGDEALAVWRELLSINGAGVALAKVLPNAPIPTVVALAGVRATREHAQHQELAQALMRNAGVAYVARQLTPADLKQMAREAIATGDPARGEAIYRRPELSCVACHSIGGAGGKIGPDLTTIGLSAQPDYLVESLIYPNARIKVGYLSVQIVTKNNRVISGIIQQETPEQIELRTSGDEVIAIAKVEVESRVAIGSLMPAGLVDSLLPEELRDLIKFLAVLGEKSNHDGARVPMARHWNFYKVTSQNQAVGIQRVIQGDPTLTDWVPLTTFVDGSLTDTYIRESLPELGAPSAQTRGLYAAVRFSTAAGDRRVDFELQGDVRAAWLNGTPIEISTRFTIAAAKGANVLVFQLREDRLPPYLKLAAAQAAFLVE